MAPRQRGVNLAKDSIADRAIAAPIFTLVPGHDPIELVAYYPEFADYYPQCELQTKRWFVDNVQRNWTIFDAGANIGYYSILFSRLAPIGRVYAFEPTDTIDFLQRNVDHHSAANVQALRIALGARSGLVKENIYRIWGQPPEYKEYEFATIDEIVERLRLYQLDCVKIDVDSFDFEVLQGAERTLQKFNPWIVVELNHALAKRNHSAAEALEWLVARGYSNAHVLDYENYVLRRLVTEPPLPISSDPTLRLSFEQRPVVIREAFDKGPQIFSYFETKPVIHGHASVAVENGRIYVPCPRWSYAASWPRCGLRGIGGSLIIEVELTVIDGEIGLGCVTPAMDAYVGDEVFVRPATGPQTVRIHVPSDVTVGHLMLRNTEKDEKNALVLVRRTEVFRRVPASGRRPTLLANDKRRLSLAECEAALPGFERVRSEISAAVSAPGIDIVPVEELGTTLGFANAFVTEKKVYKKGLTGFQTEVDEAAIYGYIYRNAKPARHLEFGTWEGFGAVVCAQACNAEIWTVNLLEGESDAEGNPLYGITAAADSNPGKPGQAVRGDSGDRIGWRYRAAGLTSRVHQILCDSRDFDTSQFIPGFFDTVLIDGGHSPEVVKSDTNKALRLLRSGGIMIWHDFCPDEETLRQSAAPRGVVRAIVDNFSEWNPNFSKLFWIRPSWMLLGVRI